MKNVIQISILISIIFFSACQKDIIEMEEDLITENNTSLKAAQSFSLNNWMKNTDQNKSIAYLSVPGTHDSGARHESIYGTAKCQDMTIAQQLNAGVRYLDIRCRHFNNTFEIHHGAVYQKINFDHVLNACWTFLDNNPSETIIMHVKPEHTSSGNNRSFEATFNSYVNKRPNSWYLNDYIPKLKDVKGKIVLVRRFGIASGKKGIPATNWKDNTSFSINNSNSKLKIQDVYKVPNNSNKWNAITSYFNQSHSDNGNVLYLNYTSGYKPGWFGIPNIRTVSNYINPKLDSYFNSRKGKYGVVVQDFCTSEINRKIIATNF